MLFLAPLAAHAHGGGLDDLGCHHDRRAGGYHCHRGILAGRSFTSKAEGVLALGDKLPPNRPGSTVSPTTTPSIMTGRATVVDGDTLDIGGGLNMVLISPAILVYWLRDRRRKRREKG